MIESDHKSVAVSALMVVLGDVEGKRMFVREGGVAMLCGLLDSADVNVLRVSGAFNRIVTYISSVH